MRKEKQIEEMASDIEQSGMLDSLSRCRIVAEELYFKGYRNQKAVLDERAVDKAEVAIEIFEEISRHLCYLSDDDIDAIRKRIGIQEKRYTEDKK